MNSHLAPAFDALTYIGMLGVMLLVAGYKLDVVTGAVALPLGLLLWRHPTAPDTISVMSASIHHNTR